MTERLPTAPKSLGTEGKRIWRQLWSEFVFEPSDSVLLEQLCLCADRIKVARLQIAKDGLILKSGDVRKRHPAIEAERSARSQLIEIWKTLKLNVASDEVAGRPGRPPSGKRNREVPQWLESDEQ